MLRLGVLDVDIVHAHAGPRPPAPPPARTRVRSSASESVERPPAERRSRGPATRWGACVMRDPGGATAVPGPLGRPAAAGTGRGGRRAHPGVRAPHPRNGEGPPPGGPPRRLPERTTYFVAGALSFTS